MKRAKQFRPAGAPTRQEQKRQADRWRGSASDRGYTWRWSKASKTHLSRSPICIGCEAVGLVVPATLVDHVEPHEGDQVKFWDTGMWQSSCDWHHNSVKQQLEAMWRAGRIPVIELWLNSETAKRLTMGMLPGLGA
ncbi:HNH endonuclease [Neorhizobium petrolearium]|uniref:HNH endonuclease n=1 Tax=Neorhizobium petrolearium TaxID=515361 RepID=A0ABY8M277_9HYPH|nr:HNH endonuclease [Neorhizobium petrolearium]MCC2608378.1 HNH endonuclease [Neorhizobium petrolearium]WGI68657.1 HNH endonuclease [Neorhizobium petrolearium]